MRIGYLGAVAAVLATASGCKEEEPPFVAPFPYDTAAVTVRSDGASASLLVEVARTPEQKQLGLGIRPSLDPGSGMLFPYDSVQPDSAGYWMWRMKIPLDIAFLDSAGSVVRLLAVEPCTAVYLQGCPTYVPGVPYWAVLETNRGWFTENGMGEGSVVTVEGARP